jgi:16S rRNA (cytidine1402-2'-O)-methyltransferase
MQAGLYIIGTPIGNLEDISRRALAALQAVQLILAEDTRHSRHLLERYQIRTPLLSCHRFNEAARVQLVLTRIKAGAALGLVTNAGMPGISDPGARIAAACRKEGLPITVIPGPSAVTAAVALSGFGGGGFHCEGFLPRRAGARQRRLRELQLLRVPAVLFESPYRWLKLLDELGGICPARDMFVARELTKFNEECVWGSVAELRAKFAGVRIRGELVAVLAPAAKTESDREPSLDTDQESGENS